MILTFGDWKFDVDVDATRERTRKYSFEHCECGYCKNFYEVIDQAHPHLRSALDTFGINPEGPCELMPFEPTLMLACYRVQGVIEQWGTARIWADDVLITPEAAEDGSFLLWVGEVHLPWLQEEPMEDVVSPANLPEFLERMQEVWLLRHGEELVFS